MSSKVSSDPPHRVILLVRDGWGYSAETKGNAVAEAKTPNTDRLASHYYTTLLSASGTTVGLPKGEMGNSEVGHLTMGAGRSEPQELMRIEQSIKDGSFSKIQPLVDALKLVKGEGGNDDDKDRTQQKDSTKKPKLHLLGLISDGGIHSHIKHVLTLLQCIKDAQVPTESVYVHFITDGRDTPPTSASQYVQQLQDKMKELGVGKLADLIGRNLAMDRDHRWDRVQAAYDLYTQSKGDHIKQADIDSTLQQLYKDKQLNDQQIPPLLVDQDGKMEDGDVVICFNFRNDRMKEITAALTQQGDTKDNMKLNKKLKLHVITMVQYDEKFSDIPVLFPFHPVEHSLPYVVSEAGLKQFHVAETEKYAHVTFFFSGGKEEQVKGETRKMIASPKVDTYDKAPEMSMAAVGDEVVAAVESGEYELIVCNLAGADMVGHTGVYDKTVTACEAVDKEVGKIVKAMEKHDDQKWVMLLTGDHGNSEEMLDDKGEVKTSHTTNPVQLHIVGEEFKQKKDDGQKEDGDKDEGEESGDDKKDSKAGTKKQKLDDVTGGLNDIAPTILELLGIKPPKEMTGKSLLPK